MIRNTIATALAATGLAATALLGATPAHADDDRLALFAICETLDEYPTVRGVFGIVSGLEEVGYSTYRAGWLVGRAARDLCPEHAPLVLRVANLGNTSTI